MSSCWTSAAGGGGVRTCGLNLDIIKSPAAAAAAAAAATTNTTTTTTSTIRRRTHHHHHHHHCSSSSPSSSSSTIAETADSSNSTISSSIRTSSPLISSSSSSTTAVRKPRTPRKRPNQIYNEAAALLSTAYPNIFSTKNLLINSSSTSSAAKFVKPQTEHYSSSSSLNNDDSSAQLFLPLPFPFVKTSSSSQAVVSNYSCNSDSVLSDSNSKPASSKHEDDDKLPSNDNKKHHNASSSLDDDKNDEDFDLDLNYDYDLVAESILEEGNIEQGCGIDSIIGTTTTGPAATDDIISSPPTPQPPAHGNNNCHGPETNRIDFCCYGYPYPMQMPMPLPVGLGFQVGVGGYGNGMKTTKCVSAFRTSTTDDGDYWWRFQAVDVGQISPKLNNSSGNSPVSSSDIQNQELGGKEQKKKINNGSSSKKKKKKMEHINDDNNDNTTAAKVDGNIESRILSAVSASVPGSSGSNEANSIENYDSNKVMLKLNYDNVIDAWSDRPSPFSDEFPGTDTTSDNAGLSARLAQIDLFGENGGIREASVLRYKEKRRNRLFSKKIRYQVRKVNADQRPRMKGRFVRSPNSIVDRQK